MSCARSYGALWRRAHARAVARGVLLGVVALLAACHRGPRSAPLVAPERPRTAPVDAPAATRPVPTVVPQDSLSAVAAAPSAEPAGRLEFRLADTLAFAGSDTKARVIEHERLFVAKEPVVTARDVRSAAVMFTAIGRPALALELCAGAGARLALVTARHLRKRLVILVDDKPLSVAVIVGRIESRVMVDGLESAEAATRMARAISGEIPSEPCPAPPR